MSASTRARRRAGSLYDAVSETSAAAVIRTYSSSFGIASRLLAEPVRTQVCNVYALVRVADEIVDHPDPALSTASREQMLTWLHEDVRHALRCGWSANLVVHAFARTALECGIGEDLIDPFFASMRMDLDTTVHDQASFETYVYGSAEVVGLMCLRVFLAPGAGGSDHPGREGAPGYDDLAPGARRLGAAFQKINFLRDLAEDNDTLGRLYFPELDVDHLSDTDRDRILDDIEADLAAADTVIGSLPTSSRRAVRMAHATFAELAVRLRATPAAEIRRTRVRVPGPVKLRIVAGSWREARP